LKPVVAKAEEVTEEPPKIVEIKEKDWCWNKGSRCSFVRSSSRSGPTKIVEEDNQIYNTAGIEVNLNFSGNKFYKYVGETIEPWRRRS
jgi:protein TonB